MHVSPRCGMYYFAPTVIAWALDYCISLVQFFRGGGGSESAFMSHSRKSKSPCVPTATVLTKRVGWVVMEPSARFFTPPRTKVGTWSLAFVKTHCRRTSPPPPHFFPSLALRKIALRRILSIFTASLAKEMIMNLGVMRQLMKVVHRHGFLYTLIL